MSDESTSGERTTKEASTFSPVASVTTLVKSGWSTLKTLYYANSISWRVLKAGALIFFGFFLWAGSNVLRSYNPNLTVLQYPMAYGFILILYGPIHHLIVLPLAFRWRRSGGTKRRIGSRMPNAMLAIFLLTVVVLGTFPVGAMTVDFNAEFGSDGSDVNPDLLCSKSQTEKGTEVHCRLTESEGIDHIVVQNDGSQILVDEEPPYEFTIHARELESVTGEKQFRVKLEGEDGTMIRQYTKRLSMISEE